MINEFDKEMDAILRKARNGESLFAALGEQTHLDADAISAFAENALPENAKLRSTAHLADCERCRKILSNLILLNAEPASEFVDADESAAAIPWYRKLFVFPNLAYSLGALVLVFSGLIVFTVLQSVNTLRNADVSQTGDKPFNSAPAQANANLSSVPASNMAAANVPSNSNADFEGNKPAASNTIAKPAPAGEKDSDYCKDCGATTKEDIPADKNLAKDKSVSIDGADTKERAKAEEKSADVVKNNADDEKLQTERQLPSPSAVGSVAATKQAEKKARSKSDSKTSEITKVGGKTFRREGSAWVDSEYQRSSNLMLPSLTRISRGSNEYKKLDVDLRKIAEQLSGVVIVVWKSKAYRIQ